MGTDESEGCRRNSAACLLKSHAILAALIQNAASEKTTLLHCKFCYSVYSCCFDHDLAVPHSGRLASTRF